MSELEKVCSRELTPCLDENRVDEENCADNSKEIELSDISDEDEFWSECNNDVRPNGGNDQQATNNKESAFKKLTRSNRERNYRDNVRRRNDDYYPNRLNLRRYDNSRRKEIERYNVRKVIANRDFSISRSRSRSFSPPQPQHPPIIHQRPTRMDIPLRHRNPSYSPNNRDIYRHSISPAISRQKRYSPISPRDSSSPDPYRGDTGYVRRSLTPEEITRRSKHRHTKNRSVEKTLRRKKHKSKDHHRKRKKSRSKSKRRSSSLSPEPAITRNHVSPSRQIMNVPNSNLPHENIKIILKNEDFSKRSQKIKKRDKKSKKDKASRKEIREKIQTSSSSLLQKNLKEPHPQHKEVFASGDNIVISVSFNNNNNNNGNSNNIPSKDSNSEHAKLNKSGDSITDDKVSTKSKSKKRQASPAASLASSNGSYDKTERRQKKHKRKKIKTRKDKPEHNSKEPQTPPINQATNPTKRKNDAKPIAIIDLERSPGKEVTQSPKEVIILSDSDGENKKRDTGSKDIVIIEDTIIEKGRNHQSPIREHHTPPESPPPSITQPVLKFSLKSKSNILPFNLLHDQAEEVEDAANGSSNNGTVTNEQQNNLNKTNSAQQEVVNTVNEEKSTSNQNEAYDPFEPTKSGSASPVTPPPPNDEPATKSTNKLEGLSEKIQLVASKEAGQIPGLEEQQPTGSIWNTRKEFEKKSQQPVTPPLPPTFVFSSSTGSTSITKKLNPTLYDGIFASDLKTPVVPSPIKPSIIKPSHMDKSKDDDEDDMTPYSPSSDGYGDSNYDPGPTTSIHQSNKNTFETLKHSDTQSSEPSGSYSFGNDEPPTKTTPLKLTASTLKSFNSTMRSNGPVGLQFVNKAELSIFENYLPASQQKSPLVKRQHNSSFLRSKMSRFTSSMNENGSPHRNIAYTDTLKPPIIDETILDDDVPSSAVDLANKDRFLKKSLRIERVAEEVKLVLKPHYNKKHITKEEYKEILRKSVPKICHNKTGEINIQKITQLIEAYIKKVRYKRKSVIASSI